MKWRIEHLHDHYNDSERSRDRIKKGCPLQGVFNELICRCALGEDLGLLFKVNSRLVGAEDGEKSTPRRPQTGRKIDQIAMKIMYKIV